VSIDIITNDQTKHGTNREKFLSLQSEFYKIIATGMATPESFEELLIRFLARIENVRLQAELEARRLEKLISFHEGTTRACVQLANLIVGIVEEHRKNLEAKVQTATLSEPDNLKKEPKKDDTPTDTELLQRICLCGCQDEEDARTCTCSCHTNASGLCDNAACTSCRAREAECKPRRAPAKKKTKKTKTTK